MGLYRKRSRKICKSVCKIVLFIFIQLRMITRQKDFCFIYLYVLEIHKWNNKHQEYNEESFSLPNWIDFIGSVCSWIFHKFHRYRESLLLCREGSRYLAKTNSLEKGLDIRLMGITCHVGTPLSFWYWSSIPWGLNTKTRWTQEKTFLYITIWRKWHLYKTIPSFLCFLLFLNNMGTQQCKN